MDSNKAQRKLGIYFAGINVLSIVIATIIGIFEGVKSGFIAFIASIIVLTIIIQGYAQRRLITDQDQDNEE